MAHKVFICHAAKDKLVADAVCAALEAERISCWIAPRDVLGQNYMAEVAESIVTCRIVVVLFSIQTHNTDRIRREIEWAVEDERIIVPFCIEQLQPAIALVKPGAGDHWLDALTLPMEQRLAELCVTVARLIDQQQPVKPLWRHSNFAATTPGPPRKAGSADATELPPHLPKASTQRRSRQFAPDQILTIACIAGAAPRLQVDRSNSAGSGYGWSHSGLAPSGTP